MEKEFRFETIGKRMPYSMPAGFIQKMEDETWQKICNADRTRAARISLRQRICFHSAVITAAAAALFLVCYNTMVPKVTSGYTDVEKAFDNLSYDDQTYMIDTYNNDAFMTDSDNGGM